MLSAASAIVLSQLNSAAAVAAICLLKLKLPALAAHWVNGQLINASDVLHPFYHTVVLAFL